MPIRPQLIIAALLTGPLLALAACAQHPTPALSQTGEASAMGDKPIKLATAQPKLKRPDAGCKIVKADLPADRKAALFRQFASEQEGADAAITMPPPPPSNCRQAAR